MTELGRGAEQRFIGPGIDGLGWLWGPLNSCNGLQACGQQMMMMLIIMASRPAYGNNLFSFKSGKATTSIK